MRNARHAITSVGTLVLAAHAGLAAEPSHSGASAKIWTLHGGQKDIGQVVRIGGEVYAGLNGDMVLIPTGAVRPDVQTAGTTSPLWICSNFSDPCGGLVPGSTGDGISPFLGIDSGTDTDGDGDPDGTFTDVAAVDAGDIFFDALVCGMRIMVGSTEPTPDTDGDGLPETSASSIVVVTFYDNADNFGTGIPGSGGVPLTGFALPHFGDPTPDDGEAAAFFYTWDFSADFVDATGNPIDASFTMGNTGSATDLDSDGLADFGYSFEFEFADTNSDGDLDVYSTLLLMAPPVGDVIDSGDPTSDYRFTVENVVSPQGTGAREDIDVWSTDPAGIEDPTYFGTIEGFTTPTDGCIGLCLPPTRGLNCEFGVPYAQLAIDLFTASGCCPADANGDGVFNAADLNLFVTWFVNQRPGSCGGADMNGDGLFNNIDINLFIQLFLSQCA